MTGYLRFFRGESPLLSYGLVFTFFSSFGQTFLISVFVPGFLENFSLTNAGFGLLYSGATLGGALLLPWAGGRLDHTRLTRFTVAVVLLMSASAFLMAAAWHLAVLFVALLGLRLAGQGLSAHTALTAMARYYEASRGKALSISGLGFPLGEASLPILAALLVGVIGWRMTWVGVGVLSLLLFAPTLLYLLRSSGVDVDPRTARPRDEGAPVSAAGPAEAWTRGQVLRDPRYWALVPAALLPPFWVTGFFLYQTGIAEVKGWSVALMASAFLAFALTRVALALASGGLVDRYAASRVFPWSPLPLGVGCALLAWFDPAWVAFAFMASLGVSVGMSATVKSALWAELYGTRHLGAIKSMVTTFMVVSTAVSPVLVGWVMDRGTGLEGLLLAGVVSVVVGSVLAFGALRAAPAKRRPAAVPRRSQLR